MFSIKQGVKIEGIASAVPTQWISLKEQFVQDDKAIVKFTKSTGIKGRYISKKRQTASDLCYIATEKLLIEKNIDRSKIGILVFVTQMSDYQTPASAMVLQYRLGLSEQCFAFDVNLGCSGFTCGLEIASSLLLQSNMDYALLLCGDTPTKILQPNEDMKDKMLFGDSGTSTLLKKDDSVHDMYMMSKTDGSSYKTIINPYGGVRNPKFGNKVNYMDGISVYNFSTTKAPEILKDIMNITHSTSKDYDCLILHQANKLIIDQVAKKVNFENEKNLKSIETYGNTSSASIPNTLVFVYGNNNEDNNLHCLMCGFGIGLSWSAVDCYVNKKDILSQIYSDDYYDDGFYVE